MSMPKITISLICGQPYIRVNPNNASMRAGITFQLELQRQNIAEAAMDFSFSEEQELLRAAVLRIGELLSPDTSEAENGVFPQAAWDQLGENGLLGLVVSEEYGGGGLDCLSAAIALEAFGLGCTDHGLVHMACIQNLCAIHIATYGSQEQRAMYLPKICNGEIIAAQAITEPGAGSDTSSIAARADKHEDGYVLNGSKVFISNGPIADLIVLYAVSNPRAKVLGRTSCFLVSGDAPGLSKGSPMKKMGLHSLQNGELFFSECKVPADALLGREGRATTMFSDAMNWERVLLFSTFVGKIERLIAKCVGHARERKQFGDRIGSFQFVSGKIADMKVNHELARLATYKAAWLIDNGLPATLSASISKLFASESCKAACLDAVQIHGGMGYMKEGEIERELRDSVAGTIYSGTSEIQRVIIARLCGVH